MRREFVATLLSCLMVVAVVPLSPAESGATVLV